MKIENTDKKEVFRYLGYKDTAVVDEAVDKKVEEGISVVEDISDARFVHAYFSYDEIEKYNLPEGKDIKCHLEGCGGVILFAATIGSRIEEKIRRAQVNDVLMAAILDACASVCIEAAADMYMKSLSDEYKNKGLYLTDRFSPGYGDFPVEKQHELLKLCDAQRKIGLYVTESSILVPRKSITGVVGVSDTPKRGRLAGCESCVLKGKCEYRKKGENCRV